MEKIQGLLIFMFFCSLQVHAQKNIPEFVHGNEGSNEWESMYKGYCDQMVLHEDEISVYEAGQVSYKTRLRYRGKHVIPMLQKGAENECIIPPTECWPIVEVEHAYLCISSTTEAQNHIFTRISLFSEGGMGVVAGQLAAEGHPATKIYDIFAGGHNIMSPEIHGFYEGIAFYEDVAEYRLRVDEEAFKSNLFDKMVEKENGADFIVITASAEHGDRIDKTISHETLHAQYFSNEDIQAAVQEYYDQVAAKDPKVQDRVKILCDIYDCDNRFVFYNEFFAYLLEKKIEGAGSNRFSTIFATHRQALFDYIVEQTGKTPLIFGDL